MARPTTLRGSKVLIQLEDTPGSGTFTAPCALTTKGINLSAETNDFNVPDCDAPDDPTWTERVVAALSAGVEGSGTLAMESLATWREWYLSAASKTIRVKFDETGANGGGYFEMAAVLTALNLGGNQGELATIETTIQSDGEVTWTDAA